MRAVIQRVSQASVTINGSVTGSIGIGLMVLLGIEPPDTDQDIDWLAGKIVRLRISNDDQGVMNRSVQDVGGDILLVSQFTLFASTKKGNRPSYSRAAPPNWRSHFTKSSKPNSPGNSANRSRPVSSART